MVVIHVKRSEGDGFLFETTTTTLNDDLIASLVAIHNGRLQANVVVEAIRELAAAVGDRNEPEEGVESSPLPSRSSEISLQAELQPPNSVDSTDNHTRDIPDPRNLKTLERASQDLLDYIDKSHVKKRRPLKLSQVQEKMANVREALMMAYPNLPEWEKVNLALDSIDGLKGTNKGNEMILDGDTASLWVAGKEFERGQYVSDRLGRNEKTKVIGKLQSQGSGPPTRDTTVNEEEQKAMMAHYFKRQEELKKLAKSELDGDDYLNSAWADPKEMKKNLQGLNNILAPGLGL